LEKGTGIDFPFWINTTGELGCSTEIQAETLPLLIFQREEGITCYHVPMIGKPVRKGPEILLFKTKIIPRLFSSS
jgi:hypothetical protein